MPSYKQILDDAQHMELAQFLVTYPNPFLLGWRMLGGSLTKKAPVTAGYMRAITGEPAAPPSGGPQKESTLVYKGKASADVAVNPIADNRVQSVRLEQPYVFVVEQAQGKPGPVSIGRTVNSDVTINDYSISSSHAQILCAGATGFAQLTDLGSTNGTAVGTKRLPSGGSEVIQNGYWVTLGRVVCQFFTRKGLYDHLRNTEPESHGG